MAGSEGRRQRRQRTAFSEWSHEVLTRAGEVRIIAHEKVRIGGDGDAGWPQGR